MSSSFKSVNPKAREGAQSPLRGVSTQSHYIHTPSTGHLLEDTSNRVSSLPTEKEVRPAQTHVRAPSSPPSHHVSNPTQSSVPGVPSTETGTNLSLTQGATPSANQPSSLKPGIHKRVSLAKADFAEYLEMENSECHFLSVNSPEGPLRRKDGDCITSETWASHVHDNFEWDNDSNRWRFGSKGTIVTEDQIYAVLLSYQRALPSANKRELFTEISRSIKGVQWQDVKKARELWQEHGLGYLDMADDTLWGGERRAVCKCT